MATKVFGMYKILYGLKIKIWGSVANKLQCKSMNINNYMEAVPDFTGTNQDDFLLNILNPDSLNGKKFEIFFSCATKRHKTPNFTKYFSNMKEEMKFELHTTMPVLPL